MILLFLVKKFSVLVYKFSCRSSLEKYAPLDWVGYFDEEKDISIPDSNDVSVDNLKIFQY